MMTVSIILVLLIGVGGLLGTLLLSNKSDENYSTSTKGNITRLTLIYILLGIGLLVGIAIYIIL